jgi:hypothetical protein
MKKKLIELKKGFRDVGINVIDVRGDLGHHRHGIPLVRMDE